MGYHDNKSLACDLTDKLHDLHAGNCIKSAGGLVCQKNLRLVYKSTRDCNTLALTARKLVRTLIILICKTNLVKSSLSASYSLLLIDTGNGKSKLYVTKHGLVRNQVIALENKADTVVSVYVPVAVTVKLCADTIDNKITGGVSVKTANNVKHGGLTASGRAENGNEFSVTKNDINATKSIDRL